MHAEPGPGKAVQERGGEVGLDEHPAEEVPGAEEGPGGIGDENLEVVEVEDYYDPDEGQLHRGISTLWRRPNLFRQLYLF